MCGRFFIDASKDLDDLLDALECKRQENDIQTFHNIAPTDRIPVIINNRGENRVFKSTWWFTPSWSPDPNSRKYSMFNAKSETLEQSKAFADSFQHKRCLIPATGFIEWAKTDTGKQPLEIRHPNRPLLLAGIYDVWQERLLSCAIITTAAQESFKSIHQRMPVLIQPEQAKTWLDQQTDLHTIKTFMEPKTPYSLRVREVDERINNAKNKVEAIAKQDWQLLG